MYALYLEIEYAEGEHEPMLLVLAFLYAQVHLRLRLQTAHALAICSFQHFAPVESPVAQALPQGLPWESMA